MRRSRLADAGLSLAGYAVAGSLLGVAVLHPLTMAIYWFEFHPEVIGVSSVSEFIVRRMQAGFSPSMWPMTAAFSLMGATLGLAAGVTLRVLMRRSRQVDQLQAELTRSLSSLLTAGEGETVEFKASARWDYREGKINRAMEVAVVRTIAAFMNHRGGSLLIGIDDRGMPIGLIRDLASLRRRDLDGYQQFVVGLVERHLGPSACSLIHVLFHSIDAQDVCRVVVEPASRPVYVKEGDTARYFLRTGNGTRELDARDVVEHIAARSTRA
jgi:hypothetical protein